MSRLYIPSSVSERESQVLLLVELSMSVSPPSSLWTPRSLSPSDELLLTLSFLRVRLSGYKEMYKDHCESLDYYFIWNLSPVKMFLSSKQAGYSNRHQRPEAATDHLDAILFVPATTVTANHPFDYLSHTMSTQCSRRSCRIDRVQLGFTQCIF